MTVKKIAGAYLAVLGVAVWVQFLAAAVYGDFDEQAGAWNSVKDVWLVFDVFMALGALLAVATAWQRKTASRTANGPDSRSTDSRSPEQWNADVTFYALVLLALAFFPNWVGTAFGPTTSTGATLNDNYTVWFLIDTILPVLFVAHGTWLWRNG